MKYAIIASAVLLSAILDAQPSHAFATSHARKSSASHALSGTVTYNRDSKDPNVGWHWEGGMRASATTIATIRKFRAPAIPARNVQAFGMPMRECDWSSQ